MSSIFTVFGPPGTGKTTYLSDQAAKASERYGSERVVICSLTRSAANEIRSRVQIPERNVGTLHSFCYRGLGAPVLALTKEMLDTWNAERPLWTIGQSQRAAADDDAGIVSPIEGFAQEQAAGDRYLQEIGLLRHRMVEPARWTIDQQQFHAAWSAFKNELDLVDFDDMIDRARMEVPYCPGDPAVLIVDEAQDLSLMELEVIERWARRTEVTVVAGDADQWLYEWRGAYPKLFLPDGSPPDRTRALKQSYRVPRAAHREAMRIIGGCTNRVPVEYLPRDEDGSCTVSDGLLADEAVPRAIQAMSGGPEVMAIASCDYILNDTIRQLRENGIPYHNPYRPAAGRYNPLGARKGVTAAMRLTALTKVARRRELWSVDEFRAWTDLLSATKALAKGARKAIDSAEFKAPTTRDELVALMKDEGCALAALKGDMDWYEAHVQDAQRARLGYALACARRHGVEVLEKTPRVTIGTIHSVKGGQASTVVLAPDISLAAAQERMDEIGRGQDSLRRLFYVGVTRTRSDLVLCRSSRRHLDAEFWGVL